jgi:hypothetical protein
LSVFVSSDPPVRADHRRTISSLLIARFDELILRWLRDREASADGDAIRAALAAVIPEFTRGLPA